MPDDSTAPAEKLADLKLTITREDLETVEKLFGMKLNEAWAFASLSEKLSPKHGQNALSCSVAVWTTLGLFQVLWSEVDMVTDYAIWKFLKTTPEQAHLVTSGMTFGRKARLLADLIGKGDHPQKDQILEAFNKLRGAAKRDILFHSYIGGTEADKITFVERNSSGTFHAKNHHFTKQELFQYVMQMGALLTHFNNTLGVSSGEIDAFVKASFNISRKEKTSPA